MTTRRTIAVVTGSRAEFGLLMPVMRAIVAEPRLRLRVIAAGAHLASGTARDITDADFTIDARVPMQRPGITGRAPDMLALGRGVTGFARVFTQLQPDVVLLLGDRIEPLAAACAAAVGGLRVAHIHGGDRAEGVADDAMRHAISKLAHLHFPATPASHRRLIRMGEPPECIFLVGSPAADGLASIQPAVDPPELPPEFTPELIVLQHPIGAPDADEQRWMAATLRATAGYRRLVLAPNSDPGSPGIRAALRAAKVRAIEHLPRPQWLARLAGARAIVGNSSAGLIEAAILRVPAVNIGPREAGREKPGNVIDCDYGVSAVKDALQQALALDRSGLRHPYGNGKTSPRIARRLATLDLDTVPLRKRNTY